MYLTPYERSKVHVSLTEALSDPKDPFAAPCEKDRRAALAEAIAYADTGNLGSLATIFSLAEAIDVYVFEITGGPASGVKLDTRELKKKYGAATVNLALKLAGHSAAAFHHRRQPDVTIPTKILSEWYDDG
ncbi:hypothetical protein [Pseudoruegeria sp. HB172150]|uniref:hypothetical protein n=1 Tax=Pseudoruegeria sp. HB172150 TaxID=2721164 RepID=UPI001554A780|nr:hypothetical protein [Pseudoruegeria sp. HB172150]